MRTHGHHYRNKNNIIRPSIALRTLDAISCREKTPRIGDKAIFPIIPFGNSTRLVDLINRNIKVLAICFGCPLQPFNTQPQTTSRYIAQNSPRHTNTFLKALDNSFQRKRRSHCRFTIAPQGNLACIESATSAKRVFTAGRFTHRAMLPAVWLLENMNTLAGLSYYFIPLNLVWWKTADSRWYLRNFPDWGLFICLRNSKSESNVWAIIPQFPNPGGLPQFVIPIRNVRTIQNRPELVKTREN